MPGTRINYAKRRKLRTEERSTAARAASTAAGAPRAGVVARMGSVRCARPVSRIAVGKTKPRTEVNEGGKRRNITVAVIRAGFDGWLIKTARREPRLTRPRFSRNRTQCLEFAVVEPPCRALGRKRGIRSGRMRAHANDLGRPGHRSGAAGHHRCQSEPTESYRIPNGTQRVCSCGNCTA